MDISSMTDAELFANLEAISREIQSRVLKKDACILQQRRELADVARSHAESERFLGLQLRVKNDEISRLSMSSSPSSPLRSPMSSPAMSAEAVSLQGKQVCVKHPVKGMPPTVGIASIDSRTCRTTIAVVGGFIWAGEVTRDLSSGNSSGLRWTGSNAVENFPGGSSATFTLDEKGYAHGQFTSTFPGGSVAGTETYEHGELVK